eukprot:CAMPEP_0202892282 /NCGR_PEP_ID=MMETSP1392-20130828/2027_1 /ASSEMBLY_ACC=CAM_ASM_000868 /TAXON_ID=225041 /ORGANISM="Chlamydomonas chlamydogama, Strain SAG 11-48b" /LENGTH=683 /DNA_ID=CAMNT_0049576179 /DNA_START=304 /DNA_END=2355 /DNA_ORIENTATION=-
MEAPPAAVPPVPDERLSALRAAMSHADGGQGVHAYIVPTEDPHMSEYIADCFKRREYLSKFTGSAGTVVVTQEQALLWTDGRYFLQASQELGKEWVLMKAGTPGCPDLEDWLASNLPEGGRVGIDPYLHTVDAVRRLQRKVEEAGRHVVPLLADGNLVDKAWPEQPARPDAPLRVHPAEWAGQSVGEKVAALRTQMRGVKAGALLVTMLDEVAWLMNLRGSDVSYNPVFISYALVPAEGPVRLYVDGAKLTPEVKEHLQASEVEVREYGQFVGDVAALAAGGQTLWVDPSKVSYAVYQAARSAVEGGTPAAAAAAAAPAAAASPSPRGKGGARKRARGDDAPPATNGSSSNGASRPTPPKIFMEFASPVVAAKAIKNAAELAGMREAHLRDAVALCDFLCFMEEQMAAGKVLSEVQVDLELTSRRASQKGFIEPSFPTIAGAGANGAIIHYRAQQGSCKSVDKDTLLLLDSGGQYECGTTDITRTMHFGTPTQRQKMAYTRVLQGHIALDSAIFPEGTPGAALDTLARLALWREGLNYRHGTGHGVGAALNVHEGPQSISSRYHITTPLQAGMVVSNEPGYYEDGGFGIRVENLVVVKEVDTPNRYGGASYFGFEALTMVPMQTRMVDLALMTPQEEAWLDAYHRQVWEAVSPRLEGNERLLQWLRANTLPVREQQKAQGAAA